MPKIVVKVDRKTHTRSKTHEDKKVIQLTWPIPMNTQNNKEEQLQPKALQNTNPALQYLEFKDLRFAWRTASSSL